MIVRFTRKEFLESRWHYQAGQHVSALGPTGSGKTYLLWQLLQTTATEKVPAVVAETKPRDITTTEWAQKLEYPKVATYPPAPSPKALWTKKPKGYVLWPKHTMDIDTDDAIHHAAFDQAMQYIYRRGNRIFVVDEVLDFVDMKLERQLRRLWTRGRSMGVGLWVGTQQPFHVPTHAYRQSYHLFVANDPDQRSRKRYEEIGGIEPGIVADEVLALGKHEFLYICRNGPTMCVVEEK